MGSDLKQSSLADMVNYQEESVVSKTLIKKEAGMVTLFAFDRDQGLSEHIALFDALVYVLVPLFIQIPSCLRKIFRNRSRVQRFRGSKVQRFKGCIFMTIGDFVNVLYGKTDRFHNTTNLPAIADLMVYARSVNDRRGRQVGNIVFGNYVAKPLFFTRTSGLQLCPCL